MNNWKNQVNDLLPLLGHRNWILIVDAAYPLQSAASIQTMDTGAEMPEVVAYIQSEIHKRVHIRPHYFQDLEYAYLEESFCPGITDFKKKLSKAFEGETIQTIAHDAVFSKIDHASTLFKILVLKTTTTLAYTSLFVELDCGYWNEAQEAILRSKLPA